MEQFFLIVGLGPVIMLVGVPLVIGLYVLFKTLFK